MAAIPLLLIVHFVEELMAGHQEKCLVVGHRCHTGDLHRPRWRAHLGQHLAALRPTNPSPINQYPNRASLNAQGCDHVHAGFSVFLAVVHKKLVLGLVSSPHGHRGILQHNGLDQLGANGVRAQLGPLSVLCNLGSASLTLFSLPETKP